MASSHHNSAAFSKSPSSLRHSHTLTASPSTLRPQLHLDEGFSEGQSDSEMTMADAMDDLLHDFTARALGLSLIQRKQLAEALIRSLPNADKEDIGNLCERLTHFDPVHYLPNELMLHVLSYLTPKDLLTCSTVSRAWRGTSQDEKLWRSCFAREGWVVDTAKMREFEDEAQRNYKEISSRHRQPGLRRSGSHKRPHEEAFSEVDTPGSQVNPNSPGDTSIQANVSHDSSGDEMDYVEVVPSDGPHLASDSSMGDGSIDNKRRSFDSIKYTPTMFRDQDDKRLSWSYLYKQRCRLETNWDTGHYKKFQLPHSEHPNEGHDECVYTIQHNSDHLVSGSRDKTIRIWDLQKMRLKGAPLKGHEASVLCLQFDDRPEHDLIASGGSDSWVIIWRFSTGEIIKKMTNAHSESVLNLRFNDRYIVTCSKDKTIKIWNRTALGRDDPYLPAHIIDSTQGYFDKHDILQEYSLLHTLTGHGAAVNAVMIHEDTIVSASGDRTIKAWNIHSGKMKKNYTGHTKGIACVQFDGRRIVSGSSDNTVRVFDAEAGSEVACLQGHDNLVRTVQARFGDLATVTNQELREETQRIDDRFHQEVRNGMTPATTSRNGPRNAGSSAPQDLLAWGGVIPPGGGGSRWSKIISGSYDESVIIWKRDRDGRWVIKHRLRQGLPYSRSHARRVAANAAQQPGNAAAQAAAQQLFAQHQHGLGHHGAHAQVPGAGALPQQGHGHQQGTNVIQNTTVIAVPTQAAGNPAPHAAHATLAPAAAAAAAAHHPHGHRSESNRVFKLEFDARRIVCCSQNKMIIGWDFAAGDKELEQVGEWSLETQ